ncbi:phage tail protein [Flexibacterium corallicola]|uniref:phage tail protein n=1 Tax=Flexibacterium corallicola TaxID=3037259 RepID=UPI00286EC3D6|nr:tail fiber protein [Pseudovibrio sp. M1P-2-3]
MAEPFLSQITLFGLKFAVRGWALCEGQLLPIASNTALFSLLGTIYGGDGRTTFALPDLRGRFPLQPGSGPGLPPYGLGEKGGSYDRVLTVNELPSHSHGNVKIGASTTFGDSDPASNRVPAVPTAGTVVGQGYIDQAQANTTLSGQLSSTGNTGGSRSFTIQNPYLGLNFEIAMLGLFPSRS